MWQFIPEKLMVLVFKLVKPAKKTWTSYIKGANDSVLNTELHTGGLLPSALQDTSLNSSFLWLDMIAFKDICRLNDGFILLVCFSIN